MHYFKYLGTKESSRNLWENKEALEKYLQKLKELMEEDEDKKPDQHDDVKDEIKKGE